MIGKARQLEQGRTLAARTTSRFGFIMPVSGVILSEAKELWSLPRASQIA